MMKNNNKSVPKRTRLEAFIDRMLGAEKTRHPFRCTGRLLNVLSGKRWGIPAGSGYKPIDPKDSGTNRKLLLDALWRHYWTALPDISSLYENGLEISNEPEEMKFIETPRLETSSPVYTHPILMLPAPSSPEYIPEVEAEIIVTEPLSEVDEATLALQAENSANTALEFFKGDHPRWAEPFSLLKDIEETLLASSAYHSDKDSLYERLAFVRNCHHYIGNFELEFNELLNSQRTPDDIWGVPWLARGAQDLFNQQIMPTPNDLYRASLPHYLVENWRSTSKHENDPKDQPTQPSSESTNVSPQSSPSTASDYGF